ncbi:hypothetical protein CV014_20170 [Nostoc sp. CMAA1605]|nr:hypothetical protein [Nostoc sp. CMAA1605]
MQYLFTFWHWALGIGHWALGIGHWALGIVMASNLTTQSQSAQTFNNQSLFTFAFCLFPF